MTRPRHPRPGPAAQPWGQGRLLVLFAVGLATTIALVALAMAFLATLYPARQAARLKPTEALRHD